MSFKIAQIYSKFHRPGFWLRLNYAMIYAAVKILRRARIPATAKREVGLNLRDCCTFNAVWRSTASPAVCVKILI